MVPAPEGPCPRCGTALRPAEVAGVALHGCLRCGGLWLDFRATGAVLSSMHAGALSLADEAARGAQTAVDTNAAGLTCPVCHATLRRMHVGGTDVEVDRCGEHGTWFDRDELRQAAEQVAARRSGHAGNTAAAAAVATAGADGYSLSDDPRFAGVFGDDDDDEGGSVAEGVALAGAFVLFEVLLDVFSG